MEIEFREVAGASDYVRCYLTTVTILDFNLDFMESHWKLRAVEFPFKRELNFLLKER